MRYCAMVVGLLLSLDAHASAIQKLHDFVSRTHALSAHFVQSVYNGKMEQAQESEGDMMFSRPGKFRWIYRKPYAQLLVGDGKKLWAYDEDLEQVTVRKLDNAIGSSPAALLAGNNEIESGFNLIDAGQKDGMDWLEASPKGKESNFQNIKNGVFRKPACRHGAQGLFRTGHRHSLLEHESESEIASRCIQVLPAQGGGRHW